MEILLPANIQTELIAALQRAGSKEIGGILMGECLAPNKFRVTEVTIQLEGGAIASFVRSLQAVFYPLKNFFKKTHHDYLHFNYLGEWHSHPSFSLEPSGQDCESMLEIVQNPRVGATFAILMIVKLGHNKVLNGTVTVFTPECMKFSGSLILEEELYAAQ